MAQIATRRFDFHKILETRFTPTQIAFMFYIIANVAFMIGMHAYSYHGGYEGGAAFGHNNPYIPYSGDDGVRYVHESQILYVSHDPISTFHNSYYNGWSVGLSILYRITNNFGLFEIKLLNLAGVILFGYMSLQLLRKVGKTTEYQNCLFITFLSLYPGLLFNSYLTILRDPWLFACHMGAIYAFYNVFFEPGKWEKIGYGILGLFFLWILFWLRVYEMAGAILGITSFWLVYPIYKSFAKRFNHRVTCFIAVTVITVLISIILLSPVAKPLALYREYQASVKMGTDINLDFTSEPLPLVPFAVFYSIVSNFIGPFVWQLSTPISAIAAVAEVPTLFYIFYKLLQRLNKLTFPLIFLVYQAAIWLFSFSISNDNIGTATRLRVIVWTLIVIVTISLAPKEAPSFIARWQSKPVDKNQEVTKYA